MIGRTALLLGALVALAHSKAIVTNNCTYPAYVWSIPNNKGYALNRIIKPNGGQYFEPFHRGTARNPGITIKLSPEPNGIYRGKDELDFAYTIDKSDPSSVWVDLNHVRGKAFGGNVTFHTCFGTYITPHVPARKCGIYDKIEVVLCGGAKCNTSEADHTPVGVPRQYAPPFTGYRPNDTFVHRVRQFHGPAVAPTASKQLWNTTHLAEERQEKTQPSQPELPSQPKLPFQPKLPSQPKLAPDTVRLDCGCAWYDDGYKCDCEHSKKEYTCIKTGEFQYCYSDKVAKKTGSPKAFADKYAKPLLETMWTYACKIAEIHHWDCDEFKSALKAAFPHIGKTHPVIEQRNGTMPLHYTHGHAEVKRAGDDSQICLNLENLFRHEFNTFDCNEIYRDIKIKYGNKKVYLGRKKKEFAPGYDSSDMLAEFERKYPDVNWTTDEEPESLKGNNKGNTTATPSGKAKETARGT